MLSNVSFLGTRPFPHHKKAVQPSFASCAPQSVTRPSLYFGQFPDRYRDADTLTNQMRPYDQLLNQLRTTLLNLIGNNPEWSEILKGLNQLRDLHETKVFEDHQDALTGLMNWKFFSSQLPLQINKARQAGQSFGLILFDLDRFKEINDIYGHPVGNQVLRLFAETILQALPPNSYGCRIGGDEFAIILPNSIRKDEAREIARRFRDQLLQAREDILITDTSGETRPLAIATSVGVDVVEPGDPDYGSVTAESLYQEADNALKASKQGGKSIDARNVISVSRRSG